MKTTSEHASKACDQCSFRKVKCNRGKPCEKCIAFSFECSYNKPRRKRGHTGKRIGEIRSSLRSNIANSLQLSTEVLQSGDNSVTSESLDKIVSPPPYSLTGATLEDETNQELHSDLHSAGANTTEALAETALSTTATSSLSMIPFQLLSTVKWPSIISSGIVESIAFTYFASFSNFLPFIDQEDFIVRIRHQEYLYNNNFGALVLSLCAFTLVVAIVKEDTINTLKDKVNSHDRLAIAKAIMSMAVSLRESDMQFPESPSPDDILTSYFLFCGYYGCQLHHSAWFRLQEAISLAEIIGLHKCPTNDESLSTAESYQRITIYWILAVTERAYALQRYHSFLRTVTVVTSKPSLLFTRNYIKNSLVGLNHMVNLYSVVDINVVECWSGTCTSSNRACHRLTRERAKEMHRRISDAYNAEDVETFSEIQRADLSISQQWLHNRLWQLCLSHNLFSDYTSEDRELSLSYVFDIARDTIDLCKSLSMKSLEVHGIGLTEKLYDIASSVIRLLTYYPWLEDLRKKNEKTELSDREILHQYVAIMATWRGGQHPYLMPLLQDMTTLRI
ncbi:hypothetical protein V1511DRAFT_458648 [Dipodascopsis uninucleata]